jgi:hypothetical protein
MSRFDVVMTSPFLTPAAVAVLEEAGCRIHYMRAYPTAAEVAARVAEVQAHAVLTRQGPVTVAALEASPNLRIVARHGVGVDDVDVAGATARGILVTRATGSNTRAVAEHSIAMVMALAKGFRPLGHAIAQGAWRDPKASVRDLAGMRLGLLGFGGIARAMGVHSIAFAKAEGFKAIQFNFVVAANAAAPPMSAAASVARSRRAGSASAANRAGNAASSPSDSGEATSDPSAAPSAAPSGQHTRMPVPQRKNTARPRRRSVSAVARAAVSSLIPAGSFTSLVAGTLLASA